MLTRRESSVGILALVIGLALGASAVLLRDVRWAPGGTTGETSKAEIVLTTTPLPDGTASVSGARDGVWKGTYIFARTTEVREARIRVEAAVLAFQLELSKHK